MRSFTCGDGDAEKNSGGQRCESDLGKGIKDKFCCSGLADWVSLFVLFSLKKKKKEQNRVSGCSCLTWHSHREAEHTRGEKNQAARQMPGLSSLCVGRRVYYYFIFISYIIKMLWPCPQVSIV